MRTVHDIAITENIPILVRTSLNVPIENGVVVNDYRLRKAIPTLRYLADRGARVVVISHIGQKGTETLAPVVQKLQTLTPGVSFFPETIGARARQAVRDLPRGNILVLENLRRNGGETKNDPAFAEELAAFADVFVQDSFDTCHRPHASIVGVPKLLPSYAGLQLEAEVTALTAVRTPKHPALAVIGGAKFHSKEAVLSTLLKSYDHVFVGGALANDFLKADGKEVGKSLVSDAEPKKVLPLLHDPRMLIPTDVRVVQTTGASDTPSRSKSHVVPAADVSTEEIILDAGPVTSEMLGTYAKNAKTIVWNGPLGNYERGFADATDLFARAVATSAATSVVGGGDTVAVIDTLGLLSHFSFVSTGGGAMLGFLAQGTLPGIDALRTEESDD